MLVTRLSMRIGPKSIQQAFGQVEYACKFVINWLHAAALIASLNFAYVYQQNFTVFRRDGI